MTKKDKEDIRKIIREELNIFYDKKFTVKLSAFAKNNNWYEELVYDTSKIKNK